MHEKKSEDTLQLGRLICTHKEDGVEKHSGGESADDSELTTESQVKEALRAAPAIANVQVHAICCYRMFLCEEVFLPVLF